MIDGIFFDFDGFLDFNSFLRVEIPCAYISFQKREDNNIIDYFFNRDSLGLFCNMAAALDIPRTRLNRNQIVWIAN